ncbi:MAG: hypothetical protein NTY53_13775 [Kiritimatiellaeota bacterium]|nr:hypothetical protein [Kiritimatiellota bacterium]
MKSAVGVDAIGDHDGVRLETGVSQGGISPKTINSQPAGSVLVVVLVPDHHFLE